MSKFDYSFLPSQIVVMHVISYAKLVSGYEDLIARAEDVEKKKELQEAKRENQNILDEYYTEALRRMI